MTARLRFALAVALFAAPCVAQTATVTFYTPGNSAKSTAAGLLPRSTQPFTGWLFDGKQPLAHVRPGRFLTFHLKPGAHSFTVPWHSDKPGKEPLVMNIESGSQYCIRLSTKMTNPEVIPFEWLDSQIEEVPCQRAAQEAAQLKPIDINRVDPAVRAELDSATTFPFAAQQH